MRKLKILIILLTIHLVGCSKTSIDTEPMRLKGTWVLEELLMDSSLVKAMPPAAEFTWTEIEIIFPDSLMARAIGNTYNNSFGVGFEIESNQINFDTYFSTRAAEDPLGDNFESHLLQTQTFITDENVLEFYNIEEALLLRFKKNK